MSGDHKNSLKNSEVFETYISSELVAKIPKNAKTEAILWKLEKLTKSTFFERK